MSRAETRTAGAEVRLQRRAVLVTLGLALLGACGGCATTEDTDNLSEQPWNAPKNWEGGLPMGMMEGR